MMATCNQGPVRLAEAVQLASARVFNSCSPEHDAWVRKLREEKAAKEQEMASQRDFQWEMLIASRGSRYANCDFETFVFSQDAEIRERQQKAVNTARAYVEGLRAGRRENLILFGRKGTGKDHILTAVLRCAAAADMSVAWFRGFDLLKNVLSFNKYVDPTHRFVSADLVGISDPLPPSGPLQKREANALLALIDERYSQESPIVLTVNVQGREQLEERLGGAATDRFLEGASKACFDWPSFRVNTPGARQESSVLAGNCGNG